MYRKIDLQLEHSCYSYNSVVLYYYVYTFQCKYLHIYLFNYRDSIQRESSKSRNIKKIIYIFGIINSIKHENNPKNITLNRLKQKYLQLHTIIHNIKYCPKKQRTCAFFWNTHSQAERIYTPLAIEYVST